MKKKQLKKKSKGFLKVVEDLKNLEPYLKHQTTFTVLKIKEIKDGNL